MTYIIFRLLCNLFDLCCINLYKAAKHWDSFLSDCTSPIRLDLVTVLWFGCQNLRAQFTATATFLWLPIQVDILIGIGSWMKELFDISCFVLACALLLFVNRLDFDVGKKAMLIYLSWITK